MSAPCALSEAISDCQRRSGFRPRPEYQAPETVETQAELELDVQIGGDGAPAEPLDWPSDPTDS
jgi:hypothetical protein